MSTFGKATFDTAVYATSRPTYPRSLFDFIFRYHERNKGARWDRALDLGCGTGQATVELTPFRKITGIDPSAKMVEGAREMLSKQTVSTEQFDFVQSPAEKLDSVEDGSVDLVIAAQAGHWFDWNKMWPELSRVLRKGGSASFWIYSEFRVSRHPSLTPLINQYAQGTDKLNSVGPYWQQPGRSILENHLLDIPEPNTIVPGGFSDFERVFFTGSHYPDLPSPRSVILRKKMTWLEFYGYLQTWSSLHTFREANPSDAKQPEGDIATRFYKALMEGVQRESGDGTKEVKETDEVDIEWPVAMMMVKKA
ncbi:S-adenosyl-L-methionine-dependent methyltransferase [Coniophora puteana RWD-64-598 SS2]|uniref:S-adenosyl-L-methionine-dependent methyltransferase n=1 Tax=Coniophora puteana (strain RWD-64-598) TaxID=741705 RepID=A0A5M3M935_CONPW|nr:S-adenosyl-L-methionine-dependent methyltransferase [Coniophora puteana RWD-64-598 SS2]EIW75436.1 S-adenosyl-L-methionine-dependent methyltransferase [Coniophora puteana RWD-64-598 SS2]